MAYNDLTNMLTVNPWMFDPSQLSNQFSNYNNQRMPGPSYNPGLAGGPVNAATGQPIASYQQWAAQNPAGMTLNATPATPQPAPAPSGGITWNGNTAMNSSGQRATPSQIMQNVYSQLGYQPVYGQVGRVSGQQIGATPYQGPPQQQQPQATAPQAQTPSQPGQWQAALNALANPGNPVTPGATVPMATGSQPAGGVNQAWLQGIGGGQGMNQNFISALRNIQGR